MAKRQAEIKNQKVKACKVSRLITRKGKSKLSLKKCSEETKIQDSSVNMLIG